MLRRFPLDATDGAHAALADAGAALAHVAFSRDGRTLLTCVAGRAEHGAQLWDAATGALLLHFRGHDGGVLGGALSPDGRTAITCSKDRTARIWATDPLAAARALSLRPLTPAELQQALRMQTALPTSTATTTTPK